MEALIQSIAEMAGLGTFMYYLFRALSAKISGLEGVVSTQKEVIEAMSRRIEETEKIGGIYKNLLSDLPADLENYKTIISKTKDDVIVELLNHKVEADKRIRELKAELVTAGASEDKVARHLVVLKNLIVPPVRKDTTSKRELDLKTLCEFDDRTLEDQVPIILEAKSVEEFLGRSGFVLHLTEDDSVLREVFSGKRPMERNGKFLRAASASNSGRFGWYLLADENVWVSSRRLEEWRLEFAVVKAGVKE